MPTSPLPDSPPDQFSPDSPVRLELRFAAPGVGPNGQTPLTRSVLDALDRPPLPKLVPTTFRTVLSGLLTAGTWPAVMLPYRWLQTLRWHRSLFRHLAEWAGVDLGDTEARQLHDLSTIRLSRTLTIVAGVSGAAAVVVGVLGVLGDVPAWEFWYADPVRSGSASLWMGVFLGFLGLAYVLQWLSVNVQVRQFQKIEQAVGEMTLDLGPMRGRSAGGWAWGIRPVPTTIAALLTWMGIIWALPMLTAATAQRRVILMRHRQMRQRVAGRVRKLLANRRPTQTLPAVVDRSVRCANRVCDAPVPPDAKFCPRCGTVQSRIGRYLD